MAEKNAYFVSGIDTDAGKSYATGYLARFWREQGRRVITQKFIQTGCPIDRRTGCHAISEDIALHRAIMGTGLLPEDTDHTTCPIRLGYPASPDLAARLEGRQIDLSQVDTATGRLLQSYDVVLLEGAGGLMVPVRGLYTSLDYIAERGLEVILVTNPRLGSINHTMLSLEACRSRGVRVAMTLYNLHPETSPRITADTREAIADYLALHHPECRMMDVPVIETDW
ncbi:ATP-dependent dethiobiotin synthetase BioD [Bacteroidia bacterium]|nr:ATP-dependent dethiobiotin synthetase BioD [Bacteroidia bacterium]